MEVDGCSYNLWSAARCGNVRALRLLLDRGVPADQVCDEWTALHHAASDDQVEAAHLLLERGAAVDKGTATAGQRCTLRLGTAAWGWRACRSAAALI